MTRMSAIRDRLQQASAVPAFLDAAYEAFEVMLSAIEDHQDPASGQFSQFVYAATCAANGRDAIAAAPSLPSRPIHPWAASGHIEAPGSAADAEDLVALSKVLARLLAHAAETMSSGGDRAACHGACGQAAAIHRLLTGSGP